MVMVMTKDEKRKKDLDLAIDAQKKYKELCGKIDRIYEGFYEAVTGKVAKDVWNSMFDTNRVKTHLLFNKVEDWVAIHMPPRGDIVIPLPRNEDNIADIYSAKTADSLLEYHLDQGGYDEIEDAVRNRRLHNYGYLRVGFRPSITYAEGIQGNIPYDDYDLFLPQPEDKLPGQAYLMSVHPKDIVRAVGFRSVQEAWAQGGFVARRYWAHIDWVKSQKSFKNTRDLKADVMYKGQEPDEVQQENNKKTQNLQYCELWEMFYGPTNDKPDGEIVIRSNKQDKTLYEHEGKLFKGFNFPIIETCEFRPRTTQYAVPVAGRALNPMFEHEYYETDMLKKIDGGKDIIFETMGMADTVREDLEDFGSFKSILIYGSDEQGLSAKENAVHIPIRFDFTGSEMGSARSLARFEDMMGTALTKPRIQGGEIATQMVIEERKSLQRTNKARSDVADFVAKACRAVLDVDKELMSEDQMRDITRSVNRVWHDDDEYTLEGDFSVQIEARNVLDMTEGERSKALQMVLSTLAQYSQVPGLAKKYDPTPVLKAFLKSINVPTGEVFTGMEDIDQWHEITAAYAFYDKVDQQGNPIPPIKVEPDENHAAHIGVLKLFFQMLDENNGQIPEPVEEILIEHAEEHKRMFEMQSQGAMNLDDIIGEREGAGGNMGGDGLNAVNAAREAGGANMGGGFAGLSPAVTETN